MLYGASTLTHLEDALAEAFSFHRGLDDFVLRSGIQKTVLQEARRRAELRNRTYSRAPKRLVAAELVNLLNEMGSSREQSLSRLCSEFVNFTAPVASPIAETAIRKLRNIVDKERRQQREAERLENLRKRETEERKWKEKEAVRTSKETQRAGFLRRFEDLVGENDAQKRGYLLESFLKDFFDFETLDPRKSFRIRGEQIDGSISWSGRTYLVEAKWQRDPVTGSEFGEFLYKIEGKSADTRGLFVSINGYSEAALDSLKTKGAAKFICMDGAHVVRSLHPSCDFKKILSVLWRHVSETGEAYLPVSKFS